MNNDKKFTMHVNLDAFAPASEADKEYMVKMRPSSTFFKDGVRRLLKNKIATISFIVVILITIASIVLPMVWPYHYDDQLGVQLGKPVDASYNNLAPFTYGTTEKLALLGKVNAHEIFIEAPTAPTSEYQNVIKNSAKARADEILAEFLAGDRSEESFIALQKHASTGAPSSILKIGYNKIEGGNAKTFEDSISVFNWAWETTAFGNGVRKAGDTAVIEAEDAYHVMYFSSYEGETKDIFPHIFGTDSAGRDYFIRIVYGTRISLAVGFFASIIVLIIGMTVGSISGYIGGKVDLIIMRIVDIIYSLPDMLMVILLASVLKLTLAEAIDGTIFAKLGSNMISLFIVFGLLYWVSMSRLIRGQILSLREQEYVLAAKAAGAKSGWIITKHLVPNCISVIIISTALQIPSAIFTESYLSFLGLGVNAPMPSLGSLASDALNGMSTYPYRLVIPAVVISLIVLSLNLFGDGLRDAFDPKLNN